MSLKMGIHNGPFAFFLVLVAITAEEGAGTTVTVSTCTEEFKDQNPKHTLCFEDRGNITEQGVSEANKQIIVDYHNQVRRESDPVATDLTALVWDENLAMLAQKWAKQCTINHDKNKKYRAYGKSIGQNIAAGQRDWSLAMRAWYREFNFFQYGENPQVYLADKGGWGKIGHYTQMVGSRTQRIGCGYAKCPDVKFQRFYVCNYARGQLKGALRRPYTNATDESDRCSACPGYCKDGLCDCGGKLCMNNGIFDVTTCSCKCQRIFKGPECTELECPEKDKWFCGKRPQSHCTKFSNIPFDCPYKCGFCPPS